MLRKSSRSFVAYSIASLLGGIAGSIYYTYRTPYVYRTVGETRGAELIAVIVASEQLPGFIALLTGPLADTIGRRKILVLSLATPILYLLIGLVDPSNIPLITFTLSFINVFTSPALSGVVMVLTNRRGRSYSILMSLSSIGWAIGGLFPYFLVTYFGSISVFFVICILHLVTSTLLLIFYPKEIAEKTNIPFNSNMLSIVKHVVRKTYLLCLSAVFANAGLSLFYSVMGLRIYGEVGNLLVYGALLSTLTALAGAIARPFSGLLVDIYNPTMVAMFSILSYYVLDSLIYYTRGYLSMVLWILPIYPFRDTAMTLALARSVELEYQSSLAGVFSALNTLSGLLILFLSRISNGNMFFVYTVHLTLLTISLITLIFKEIRDRENLGLKEN
ncbi:MAG: MFS transporter [Desulfurococcaceae archaeon]